MSRRIEFQAGGPGEFQVDPVNGIIRDVAVITTGEARGHDLHVDETTLAQLRHCALKKGTIPVKWNHKSGADDVAGFLDNFRIRDGEKLLADLHLLKSSDRYDQALEMATRMPNNFGLSAAFMGDDERRGTQTFARCSELLSVDLVAAPAVNPDGLFERADTTGSRAFARVRNADGEFAAPAEGGLSPNTVAAAYNPQAIAYRKAQQQGDMPATPSNGVGEKVLTKFIRRAHARQQAQKRQQQVEESPVEFARREGKDHSIVRTAAGLAVGAGLGSLAGLKAAQLLKYRPARAGENLVGRVVATPKKITIAGIPVVGVQHVGVVDDLGRVAHSSPGVGVATSTKAKFTDGGKLYVERGASPASGTSVRAQANADKGRAWGVVSENCEGAACRLVGRKPASPQLRAAVAGAAATGVAGGAVAGRRKKEFYDSRQNREMPGEVKAGLSGAASGALLGSLALFRKGVGVKQALRSIGIGAGTGAALVGGGSYIGSKLIGAPREDEGAPYTKRAAIGGSIAGGALGALAGVAALKTKFGAGKLASLAKDWRPAEWVQRGGTLRAAGIGAAAGGLVGGAHAADEGQQVDTLDALKKSRKDQTMQKQFSTRREPVAAYKLRKDIKDQDEARRDRSLVVAGSLGAGAGALANIGRLRAIQRAGLGAAAGAGSVLAVRAATAHTKDRYGDRSRGAKRAENVLPVAAGLGAAGYLVVKRAKLFSRAEDHPKAVHELAAKCFRTSRPGTVPLDAAGLAKRLLCSPQEAMQLVTSGDLPAAPHPRLKNFGLFDAGTLDALRNARLVQFAAEAHRERARKGATAPRVEHFFAQRIRKADRDSERPALHEFSVFWPDEDDSPIERATHDTAVGAAKVGAATLGGLAVYGAGRYAANRIRDGWNATEGNIRNAAAANPTSPAWGNVARGVGSSVNQAADRVFGGVRNAYDKYAAPHVNRAWGGVSRGAQPVDAQAAWQNPATGGVRPQSANVSRPQSATASRPQPVDAQATWRTADTARPATARVVGEDWNSRAIVPRGTPTSGIGSGPNPPGGIFGKAAASAPAEEGGIARLIARLAALRRGGFGIA